MFNRDIRNADKRRTIYALALMLSVICSPIARGAQATEVDASIQRAVTYLYSVQQDGTWESLGQGDLGPDGKHYGGLTAIATYALLAAGESPIDPRLAKAITFLKRLNTKSAYVLGMRAQIWRYLPKTASTRLLIARDTEQLLGLMKSSGDARGLYYYPQTAQNLYDHSISQFGVLGLWAGVENGAEVPADVWAVMDHAWRTHQDPSGGWAYIVNGNSDDGKVDLSMTCAGVASLLIISDHKNAGVDAVPDDPKLDLGLKWISDNFKTIYSNDKRESLTHYYSLFAIERIGVAGGYKYFGDIDWFADGSDFLLHNQADNGSWGPSADMWGQNYGSVPDTCFGILFFVHGRAPIVINKLSYIDSETNETYLWNARPRDIANLTRWVGKEVESLLNWHVVNLTVPVAELHDAPILYISGSKPLTFSNSDVAKLRRFIEEGGLVLANANDANEGFSKSAKKLGKSMFPSYEFRELPDDHVLYNHEQFVRSRFKVKPRLLGLSNGIRELFLLIPDEDASHAWQAHRETSDLFPLGADIIQYATDRKGLFEGSMLRHYVNDPMASYAVGLDPKATITHSARIARLYYGGNWDPEPIGWQRLATIMHNKYQADLISQTVELGKGQLAASPPTPARSPEQLRKLAFKRIPTDQVMATGGEQDRLNALIDARIKQIQAEDAAAAPKLNFAIADLTGTSSFTLDQNQRQEIKNFVASGGTLVVDAAGGSSLFATSAEKELAAIFGEDALNTALASPLPLTDPLYTLAEAPIAKIGYRAFARHRLGELNTPRLVGIVQNGRTVAYYSREDLTAGLVGEQVDGIDGYTPDSATAIMRNVVLTAVGGR